MLSWVGANLGTISISLALVVIVIRIFVVMRKDKKKGKSSCGGNCGHCPMGDACHKS